MVRKIFCILLFLFITKYSFAQSGSVHVQVLDQNSSLVTKISARLKLNDKTIKEVTKEKPQIIVFSNITPGKYILEIEAVGFKKLVKEIEITNEKTELTLTLEIAEIVENVEVKQDEQEKSVDSTFGNFLTREQIENLPDDPEQIKKVLKQIAGDDNAIILVDGFTSDKVPTKSRISSIRIVRSSFDAEYHKIGGTYINITTRAGNARFSGSISFNFNDESLNARNSFSPRRFPEQTKNTMFYLSGPIKKDKATFALFVLDGRNFNGKSINAFLPNGQFQSSSNNENNGVFIDSTVYYNISKNHAAKFNYEFSASSIKNLGVGNFDLESRGFDIKTNNHQLRFSESGYVGKNFLNEFRFQFIKETSDTIPKSNETAIFVLDSFNSGGAGNRSFFDKIELNIADNLLFGRKNHALKIGFQFEYEKRKDLSEINKNGSFIFSSLNDFRLNRPSIYSQRTADSLIRVSLAQLGVFFQDDYRLKKNLSLSFGLRYEIQNNLKDYNNFSPRFGFTYSPLKSGKTIFRGGIGIFYDWFRAEYLSTIRSNDISQPSETIILNPSFPNPFIGGIGQILPKSFWQKDENLKLPTIFHTSFSIEQRLNKSSSLRINYIYEKGNHLFRSRNLNAPINGIRPNINFGNIINVESSAFFVRNNLNVNFSTNLKRNLSFYLSYDLSKTIDDTDGIFSLPTDNYNLRADRSISKNDRRHRFSTFVSWEIRKGIRLSGNYRINSPLPYNVTSGIDNNNDTVFNDRPLGIKRNSERGTWRNQLDLNFSWAFSFINKKNQDDEKSFSIVTTSNESNTGFDFTDPKKRFSVKFFANGENILNSVNYNNFVGVQTSNFFGKPTSSDNSRRLNLGVRFNF